MSEAERRVATASELAMYGLMLVLPLVGWGMLSAARYPIVLYGSVHLPFILPPSVTLYAVLRKAHTILATSFPSRSSLTSPRSCSTPWSCGTGS